MGADKEEEEAVVMPGKEMESIHIFVGNRKNTSGGTG